MDFNYILFTGDSTISGSRSNVLEKNVVAFRSPTYSSSFSKLNVNLDKNGQPQENAFVVDTDIITGSRSSLVSLNSQTLFEELPTINYANRWNYYTLNTGDYFVDFNSGGDFFHFASGLELTQSDYVIYDKIDYHTGVVVYKTSSDSKSDTITSLMNEAESMYFNASDEAEYFDNYDTFVNGQKIYGSSSEFPDVTGKVFGIPKKDKINELNSTSPDVIGSGFVEHQVDFYLNGMEQSVEDYMQLYTGVSTMVKAGIEASIASYNLTGITYSI